MNKEQELLALEDLNISQPTHEEWKWLCLYGTVHTKHCEECMDRVQHITQALDQRNSSLERVSAFPERLIERGYERGLNYRTRTRQEPNGSESEHLHVVCHMMGHQLRVTKQERLNLLVKSIVFLH